MSQCKMLISKSNLFAVDIKKEIPNIKLQQEVTLANNYKLFRLLTYCSRIMHLCVIEVGQDTLCLFFFSLQ